MKVPPILAIILALISFSLPACNMDKEEHHYEAPKVTVTTPQVIIPQWATFELLQKRYVYVIDKDSVAHRREIVPQRELEEFYVLKSGLSADDKIVLEGTRQVRDGDKVEFEAPQPE
jgi:membrane fusion protein (multidrug efflux system)